MLPSCRARSFRKRAGYHLILRGPLGSGKSTVAEALARAIHGEVVHLDGLADKNWDGGSAGMFRRGNVALERRARPLLAKGIPVIFDGCFYWKTQIRDLETRLPFPHESFTLKVPLSVCKVSRFEWGVPIDGLQSVALQVKSIKSHLPKL